MALLCVVYAMQNRNTISIFECSGACQRFDDKAQSDGIAGYVKILRQSIVANIRKTDALML